MGDDRSETVTAHKARGKKIESMILLTNWLLYKAKLTIYNHQASDRNYKCWGRKMTNVCAQQCLNKTKDEEVKHSEITVLIIIRPFLCKLV